jgi:glyoxylase-like metal-dependent hydrolase (beta-lactamase superfamily II)
MILESFPVGPLQANCTLLGDEESGEAIVVDPGGEAELIYRRLIDHGLKLKQILLTHAHLDHVGGAAELKRLTGAPILLHDDDLPLIQSVAQQAEWMGMEPPKPVVPDASLVDGQLVGLSSYPAQVLHTPGHTQGSLCLFFAPIQLLIAGDTLFAGSIGRTDLPGGSSEQIFNSIKSHILALPDETRVLTGHGPATTIGRERRSNPFLQGL